MFQIETNKPLFPHQPHHDAQQLLPEVFETVLRLSLAPANDAFMTQFGHEFGHEFGGDPDMFIHVAYKGLVQGLRFDIVKQGPSQAHEGSDWNRRWRVLEAKRCGVGTQYPEMIFEQMHVAWTELARWEYDSPKEESGMMAHIYVAICQHIRTGHSEEGAEAIRGLLSW